jgi:hypothetical protein
MDLWGYFFGFVGTALAGLAIYVMVLVALTGAPQ